MNKRTEDMTPEEIREHDRKWERNNLFYIFLVGLVAVGMVAIAALNWPDSEMSLLPRPR